MAANPEAVWVDQASPIADRGSEVRRVAGCLRVDVVPAERPVQNFLLEVNVPVSGTTIKSQGNLRVAVISEGEPAEPWFVAYLVDHPRFAGDGISRREAIETLVGHLVNDVLTYRDAEKLTVDAEEAQTTLAGLLVIGS